MSKSKELSRLKARLGQEAAAWGAATYGSTIDGLYVLTFRSYQGVVHIGIARVGERSQTERLATVRSATPAASASFELVKDNQDALSGGKYEGLAAHAAETVARWMDEQINVN